MPFPTDYLDAHRQHLADAELLFTNARLLNADQLYGMCAECGLKAVMLKSGMSLGPSGAPAKHRHKQHIDKLWAEFRTTVSGRVGARYLPMLTSVNPFTAWSIHNRYANHSKFAHTDVTQHRSGAKQVKAVVKKAQQDGLL